MEQVCFSEFDEGFYEIDSRQTVKEALKILKRYRAFKLGFREYEVKVTASYSLEPKTFSNEIRSSVEDNVIRKLDYLKAIEDAVNRITDPEERLIIIDGYMSKHKHNWIKMSERLLLNKTDYYVKRNNALVHFAIALNKEVYIVTDKHTS
ncbi:MAG: ArpU family phage packaging/lysis transcriptional regulator [Bacilli bacterium]